MIGVFDSGFGGLTVLKHFLKDLPDYNYIYFGDNARAPYGSKSQESIFNYTKEAIDFLFSRGCKLIIVACNSASSQALRRIQQEYLPEKYPDRKVLGVIRPLVEEASRKDGMKKVGVLGTRATIESNVYKIELDNLKPNLEVIQQSAPLLVPLIEEGWAKRNETKKILKKYLRLLKESNIQSLILACTHYPFLIKEVRSIMGKNCEVCDGGEVISRSLENYLSRHEELGIKKANRPQLKFYTSDDVDKFKEMGEKFLEQEMKIIEKIKL